MPDVIEEEEDLEQNKVERRIKDLSEKVKLTSQERDELAEAKKNVESEKDSALKERDFYKEFNTSIAQYPAANDYQDKIKEKVMSGYTVEDATVSVLAKEGRLNAPDKKSSPAGGSASTTLKDSGEKTIAEMDQKERRAILEKNLDVS